jgi:hypothetical protein
MSKKKKKSKCDTATIALATSILNLVITIITLIEKIIN